MTGNYPIHFLPVWAARARSPARPPSGHVMRHPTRKDIARATTACRCNLAFLVVDETCTPVPNASLDIWHCAPEGLYSGDDASDSCTDGDATAAPPAGFAACKPRTPAPRDFDTCSPAVQRPHHSYSHDIRVGGTNTSPPNSSSTTPSTTNRDTQPCTIHGRRATPRTPETTWWAACPISQITHFRRHACPTGPCWPGRHRDSLLHQRVTLLHRRRRRAPRRRGGPPRDGGPAAPEMCP